MRHTFLPLLVLALCVPAGGALAQEPNTDVPQTFWVELGGFRVQSDTRLRLSGGAPGAKPTSSATSTSRGRRPRPTSRPSGALGAGTRSA